jgi:hypothetical protein
VVEYTLEVFAPFPFGDMLFERSAGGRYERFAPIAVACRRLHDPVRTRAVSALSIFAGLDSGLEFHILPQVPDVGDMFEITSKF